MVGVSISEELLDAEACLALVADELCGGSVSFVGSVRKETNGRRVTRLEFECYTSMAEKEMQKIGEAAIQQFSVSHVVIHHRIGVLLPGDVAVVIAVSSPHRRAAFEACSFAIDRLKETVPIWKKEVFEDGEQWVSAHP
ncbi:molybdenum cofactor biosynthesis protein MoaE [Sphingobacterium suaedae]|uniref:Molybdopterin synthase catalytic subunit n=1 Tax=Sphingobacterium suaedae TaxID=1686402 RepID=A0ABW5KGF9_9SPHI